jgi:hypothetical protein
MLRFDGGRVWSNGNVNASGFPVSLSDLLSECANEDIAIKTLVMREFRVVSLTHNCRDAETGFNTSQL